MKKALLVIGFGMFLVSPVAFATENTTTSSELIVEDPGILPDSPFYFFKTTFESVQLFFTFGKDKKALLETKLANKRLKEAEKLAEKGKTDLAVKHLENWQRRMNKVISKLEERKDKGENVTNVVEKLESNQTRQQEVLQTVYEKVPESAKEAVLKAQENSRKGLDKAVEKLQNK